ncbi:MAG: hypothetical protein KDC48_03860 [Planctomycetes bacterium]|nr:hypothetical protein [Planctomycetota bacterium]
MSLYRAPLSSWLSVGLVAATAICQQPAQQPAPQPARAASKLPVREVTVFKDGHAYLIREMPLAAAGRQRIVLDELPAPVLGTFWPYASGGGKLISAVAGRQEVDEEVPAVDMRQIARANVGKDVAVQDYNNNRIEGRLVDVAARSGDADENRNPNLPVTDVLLVATATGTRALPLAQVRDLEIRGELQRHFTQRRQDERLSLEVDGGGEGATVGVMYVQRGLRWIPSYRLDIDGAGAAKVQLQATLVNDLIDLERATVHLVIGVPKFEFQGLVDPISLQQELAQVAANVRDSARFSNMLSNSLMTQSMGYMAERAAGQGQDPDPAVQGSEANEDLFVFTLRDVTLEVGERLVMPIESFDLAYRDVYKLDVTFAPPMEVRQNLQSQQVLELAKELAAPKAVHVLRLTNKAKAPLTTAPALVFNKGRILAQGRMRYTPIGAETDLAINTAVDICVTTEEHEKGRVANAERFDGNQYGRIDLVGSIVLRNDKRQAVEIVVTRRILGLADTVGQDGAMQQLDLVNLWQDEARPIWWSWWNWPYWWFRFNGFGEFRWKVTLEPKASTTLEAGWHYFWR